MTGSFARRRIFVRSLRHVWFPVVLLTTSVSSACTPPASEPVAERPAPEVSLPVSSADDVELAAALEFTLRRLLAGDPAEGFLAGDRLLVVTPETFAEVGAATDLLSGEVSFGGGCPGVCTETVESVLRTLAGDLGDPVVLDVPVPASLSAWRSVSFQNGSRSWRVSLGSDRRSLVAIEYFGPTPMA